MEFCTAKLVIHASPSWYIGLVPLKVCKATAPPLCSTVTLISAVRSVLSVLRVSVIGNTPVTVSSPNAVLAIVILLTPVNTDIPVPAIKPTLSVNEFELHAGDALGILDINQAIKLSNSANNSVGFIIFELE